MPNQLQIEFNIDAQTTLSNLQLQKEAELLKNYINKYIQENFKINHLEDQRAILKITIDEETYSKNYTELDLIN